METYFMKELIGKSYKFINDQIFTRLIDDKFTTSLIFKKWCKKSFIVKNKNDLSKFLPKIKSTKFVVKPLSESGGKDVYILNKNDDLKKIKFSGDFLLQEFIDSSKGVPDISHSMHDLRVVIINEKIIYSYIREPKENSYLANLSQGGSLKIVPKNKLPKSILPIIKHVNEVFISFCPRVFAVDFMFDENGKPWIVEFNSMPGLFFTKEEKPYMMELYKELIEMFKLSLKK